MTTDRLTRVNELLKREIGQQFYRVFQADSVDLAAITVTRVDVASNLRTARVMISILGHEEERDKILRLLRSRVSEIQDQINRNLKLKYTPRLSFELDLSIEKGDRVLGILMDMEKDAADEMGEDI